MTIPTVEEILQFWFGNEEANVATNAAMGELWWGHGTDTDRTIRDRFGDALERATAGELDPWAETSRSALALVILLDQFSRNVYRDTPWAFAQDEKALELARQAIARGAEDLRRIERVFLYLPFMHSEKRADQERSLTLFASLRDGSPAAEKEVFANNYDFAVRHWEIVERFGRFPHRNAILGRQSTEEELRFLEQPGSSF